MAYSFMESWTSSTAFNSSPPQRSNWFLPWWHTISDFGFFIRRFQILLLHYHCYCNVHLLLWFQWHTLLVKKKFQPFQDVHFWFHCSQPYPNFSHPPFSSSLYLQSQNDEVLGRFRFLQEWVFLGKESPIISSATF